jgi:hypothetical protein
MSTYNDCLILDNKKYVIQFTKKLNDIDDLKIKLYNFELQEVKFLNQINNFELQEVKFLNQINNFELQEVKFLNQINNNIDEINKLLKIIEILKSKNNKQ